MTEEIDLDELERRLRAKWINDAKPAPALDAEATAVARKLMDRDNFRRATSARRGQTVRYRAPIITAEYYYAAPDERFTAFGSWVINILENGRRKSSTSSGDELRCLQLVAAMERRGIRVTRFETERMRIAREQHRPQPQRPQAGRRRAILDQLKDFRR